MPFIRNLLFHVYPLAGNGVWQWNVKQLLKRSSTFNGQRFISIVQDDKTDSVQSVKDAFQGAIKNNDFLVFRNDPVLGEVVSFEHLLRRVESIDPRQIVFYGHAKGVRHGINPAVKKWTETMYSNLMDYPSLVDDALSNKTIVGTFRMTSEAFTSAEAKWHYSGTYYWFRNNRVFSQAGWNRIPRTYWGTEAWPGVIANKRDSVSLFMEWEAMVGKLYRKEFWDSEITPEWQKWQIQHANLHRHCSYREVLNSLQGKKVIVTGPQRSGTMIAAKILATDLKVPFLNEESFATHDFNQFMDLLQGENLEQKGSLGRREGYVIQCPTMSGYCHLMPPGVEVVFLRRNLQDILRSQKRIGWGTVNEQLERDRYFEHSNQPAATIKVNAWERFQRIALGERAFDLDYESLASHPLWIDAEKRKNFKERQYSI